MTPPELPTLHGSHISLIPMSTDHLDALCAVGLVPEIWRWMPVSVRSRDDMRAFIANALAAAKEGTAMPFVTMWRENGRVVGATRFMSMALAHRRVEIGGTWIAPAYQRTLVNTEAKYLMLRHAFEVMRCQRVEFKTNALNARSRAAILRLGAVEEGTLRKHMLNADGTSRDSVYFSIVDDEWPSVRARLETMLRPAHSHGRE